MVKLTLGIIGGGQLGSMLSHSAAKKLNIKTIVFCDDVKRRLHKNFQMNLFMENMMTNNKINEFVKQKLMSVTFRI